ncbi:IS200/IS605 family transposase, partial [Patescibacteria group bacterium]|nr:IS200/IS605 family transposase [Patescibacteria group bacterium]
MSNPNRHGCHTVTRLTVHLVWITKYRYQVLAGEVQRRCRELLMQICDAEDIKILKGAVGCDHVHMHIEFPPRLSVSEIVKKFKGRTSRKLQQEYPHLQKRYWGRHFWGIGYGAWTTGNVTEDMITKYIENHKDESNEQSQ